MTSTLPNHGPHKAQLLLNNPQNHQQSHSSSQPSTSLPASSPPYDPRLILLNGLPGTGKTTLGRSLAHHAGLGFLDLDLWMEQYFKKPLTELFSEGGKEPFRDRESQALSEALKARNHVISLGGGTLLSEKNRQLISQRKALSVWFDHSPGSLSTQISQLPNPVTFIFRRPLMIQALSADLGDDSFLHRGDDPLTLSQRKTLKISLNQYYQALLSQRLEYYNQCHRHIPLSHTSLQSASVIIQRSLFDVLSFS